MCSSSINIWMAILKFQLKFINLLNKWLIKHSLFIDSAIILKAKFNLLSI